MTTPMDRMFDDVDWKPVDGYPGVSRHEPGAPHVTHSGVWEFNGAEIRVYRLSDGRAIIHADDFAKVFGCTDEELRSLPEVAELLDKGRVEFKL